MTHRAATRISLAALASVLLASCGGDDAPDTPIPPTPPTNAAPQFTSPDSATLVENADTPLLTAAATDADGDALTFSLDGTDGNLFTLGADGVLTFTSPPDFEAPGDDDADNTYAVTLSVTDGTATTTQNVTITVTDIEALPNFVEVADGFTLPVLAKTFPGTNGKLLVLEKAGRALLLDPATGTSTVFADLRASINSEGEGGLLGFAVSPDFATDDTVYLHVNNVAGDTEIRRYQLDTPETLDPASVELILQVQQFRSNHNAGSIGFDANGFLVVPLGDGGGANDPLNAGQDPQSLLGKVLRLDVSRDAFPDDPARNYAIPAGNTFADSADGLPEIFAMGLRNPYRSTFDPATGDLILADVGQDAREEINRLPMDDSSLNFGWAIQEGTLDLKGPDTPDLTDPVAEYGHGNGPTQGNSITGGAFYQGEGEALRDAYVFADFSSDNIWAIPADISDTVAPLVGEDFYRLNDDFPIGSARPGGIVALTTTPEGTLYVTTIGGSIYRLEEVE